MRSATELLWIHMSHSVGLDLAKGPGDNRARTGNLRRAKAVLSQLSYVPENDVARFQALSGSCPATPYRALTDSRCRGPSWS